MLVMRNWLKLKKSKTTAKYKLEYNELQGNGYSGTSLRASIRSISLSFTVFHDNDLRNLANLLHNF